MDTPGMFLWGDDNITAASSPIQPLASPSSIINNVLESKILPNGTRHLGLSRLRVDDPQFLKDELLAQTGVMTHSITNLVNSMENLVLQNEQLKENSDRMTKLNEECNKLIASFAAREHKSRFFYIGIDGSGYDFRSSYYGQADGAKAGAAAAISIYSYIADVLNIKELDASIIPPQIMISIFLDIAVRANQLLEDQLIVDVDYFYTFVAGFNSVYTFVQMIDVQNHFLQAKFTESVKLYSRHQECMQLFLGILNNGLYTQLLDLLKAEAAPKPVLLGATGTAQAVYGVHEYSDLTTLICEDFIYRHAETSPNSPIMPGLLGARLSYSAMANAPVAHGLSGTPSSVSLPSSAKRPSSAVDKRFKVTLENWKEYINFKKLRNDGGSSRNPCNNFYFASCERDDCPHSHMYIFNDAAKKRYFEMVDSKLKGKYSYTP